MFIKEITLGKCEHEGDLEKPFKDLRNSGTAILEYEINDKAETAKILVQVDNVEEFMNKYRKTGSFGLSSLNQE